MGRWRRRAGVISTPQSFHPALRATLDGGRDAPFGPKDRAFFKWLCLGVVALGVVLLAIAWLE